MQIRIRKNTLTLLRTVYRHLKPAAGTVLIGVGQAVLSLLWLSALPMFSYRTSYLFLLGSHAAATALCAIVLQCPQEWYIPITLASLLAACACWR